MKQAFRKGSSHSKTGLGLGLRQSGADTWHPFRSHFSGQQGSWLRCFRRLQNFPTTTCAPEQNNAPQKVCLGRSTCRAGVRDLPLEARYLVRCNVGYTVRRRYRGQEIATRSCPKMVGVGCNGPMSRPVSLIPPSVNAVLRSTQHHSSQLV
jgi:hypothetical protein